MEHANTMLTEIQNHSALNELSVSSLKEMIQAVGLSHDDCIEKGDLVARAASAKVQRRPEIEKMFESLGSNNTTLSDQQCSAEASPAEVQEPPFPNSSELIKTHAAEVKRLVKNYVKNQLVNSSSPLDHI